MCSIHIEFIPDTGIEGRFILLHGDDSVAMARLQEQVANLAAKREAENPYHGINA